MPITWRIPDSRDRRRLTWCNRLRIRGLDHGDGLADDGLRKHSSDELVGVKVGLLRLRELLREEGELRGGHRCGLLECDLLGVGLLLELRARLNGGRDAVGDRLGREVLVEVHHAVGEDVVSVLNGHRDVAGLPAIGRNEHLDDLLCRPKRDEGVVLLNRVDGRVQV